MSAAWDGTGPEIESYTSRTVSEILLSVYNAYGPFMAIDRRKRLRDLRCSCYQAGRFAATLLALQTAIYLAAALEGDFSGSGSGSGIAGFTYNGAGTV